MTETEGQRTIARDQRHPRVLLRVGRACQDECDPAIHCPALLLLLLPSRVCLREKANIARKQRRNDEKESADASPSPTELPVELFASAYTHASRYPRRPCPPPVLRRPRRLAPTRLRSNSTRRPSPPSRAFTTNRQRQNGSSRNWRKKRTNDSSPRKREKMQAVSVASLGGRYFDEQDSNTDTLCSELTEKGVRDTCYWAGETPTDGRLNCARRARKDDERRRVPETVRRGLAALAVLVSTAQESTRIRTDAPHRVARRLEEPSPSPQPPVCSD
jgi:hypothetical protein